MGLFINPYLERNICLLILFDSIRKSDNKALFDTYNEMLNAIKYEKRYVNEKSLNIELRNRFRLTEEQINFIRK